MNGSARRRGLSVASLVGIVLSLLILAVPSPVGISEARHPSSPRHVEITPLPILSASQTRGASPAAVTAPISFDWDGMGVLTPPGVASRRVAGLGAAMVADTAHHIVVLFGGEGAGGLTNLTLTVNQTTARWLNVTKPMAPSPRANMSFADEPTKGFAVLFGGTTDPATGRSDNQTWRFWYANSTWQNVTHRVAPPPRQSAAFAVDPSAGVALLEGGWDPAYVSGGSTGSVTWNDSWLLNLTSMVWTDYRANDTPGPMFGSSLTWAPTVSEFLMYGGCYQICTSTVYALNLSVPRWHVISPAAGSAVPPPRGGADSGWASLVNSTIIFGGFGPNTLSFSPYNDTYVFDPVARTWTWIQGPPDPPHKYGAAGAWLDGNRCPGLFVAGGSNAFYGPPADLWILDQNPDYGLGCNLWGNDQVGNNTGNQTGCNGNATLLVVVADNATHARIPGAAVALSGACGPLFASTNQTGVAKLTKVPFTVEAVRVSASDYHPNGTVLNVTANLSRNGTPVLFVNLTHLPQLRLHTWGQNLTDPLYSLGNVTILMFGLLFGTTNRSGWLNQSSFTAPPGTVTFLGEKPNYSMPQRQATVPYFGILWVNLTLRAYGLFAVNVLEAKSGVPVIFAVGVITPTDIFNFGGPTKILTDLRGWFNVTLPLGNYTVSAGHSGFLNNYTIHPVFHPWVNTTVVLLNLTQVQGFNVTVRLRDAVTHLPIAGGTVEVGYQYHRNTSSSGWANFSNIRPSGSYEVIGLASGYLRNQTTVSLDYFVPRVSLELNLTPLPCSGSCGPGPAMPPFSLLPTSGVIFGLFLAAPVLLVLTALAYVAFLRRRGSYAGG